MVIRNASNTQIIWDLVKGYTKQKLRDSTKKQFIGFQKNSYGNNYQVSFSLLLRGGRRSSDVRLVGAVPEIASAIDESRRLVAAMVAARCRCLRRSLISRPARKDTDTERVRTWNLGALSNASLRSSGLKQPTTSSEGRPEEQRKKTLVHV